MRPAPVLRLIISSPQSVSVSIIQGTRKRRRNRSLLRTGTCAASSAASSAGSSAPAGVPSLDELRRRLERMGKAETGEGSERGRIEGSGAGGVWENVAKASTRLFGQGGGGEGEGEAVRVVLYRDDAAWCPFCQRVWLQLEEKRISYRVEKINLKCYGPKPDWFLQLVPNAMLPAVQLDGRVITESVTIMKEIEAAFPDHLPLLPPPSDAHATATAEQLMGLERRLTRAWLLWTKGRDAIRWLGGGSRNSSSSSKSGDSSRSSNGGDGASSGEESEGRRESSGEESEGRREFEAAIDAVEEALVKSGGPYFLGKEMRLSVSHA
ncbi:hypothetical protein CLOM_g9633 [Closterium sp. NIES-68]|nr:hypothetical protein CLOM_g9633 [Closterium sp. NIES-68]